jgi:hypothetical protein
VIRILYNAPHVVLLSLFKHNCRVLLIELSKWQISTKILFLSKGIVKYGPVRQVVAQYRFNRYEIHCVWKTKRYNNLWIVHIRTFIYYKYLNIMSHICHTYNIQNITIIKIKRSNTQIKRTSWNFYIQTIHNKMYLKISFFLTIILPFLYRNKIDVSIACCLVSVYCIPSYFLLYFTFFCCNGLKTLWTFFTKRLAKTLSQKKWPVRSKMKLEN